MNTTETLEPVRETHLKDYYRILRKHRWLVVGLFLISVFSMTIWSFVQTPIYQASATVLIEPDTMNRLRRPVFVIVTKPPERHDQRRRKHRLGGVIFSERTMAVEAQHPVT